MAYGNGRGEIRTHVTIASESVFETDAFGHSATLPKDQYSSLHLPSQYADSTILIQSAANIKIV
jgi:hypothetical protein